MNRQIVCVESPDFFLAELERVARDEGDEIVVLSHDPRHASRTNLVKADVRSDFDTAVAGIKNAGVVPDAVITSQEMFLTQAAALGDVFNVSRNPVEVVRAARDKARMKQAWARAGVRTPRSRFCTSAAQATGPLDGLTFPLVVKPTMGYASCGVRRVESAAELSDQLRQIHLLNATVVAQERLSGAGFLVEEYVDGPEFSIDTIWHDGTPLCDGILSKGELPGPYFPDRLYYVDPALRPDYAAKITDISHRAVRALGVTSGATHTEVRFRGDEPFVLETTNRPGAGGLFYTLFEHSSGVDFHRAYYLATVGDDACLRLRTTPTRVPPADEFSFWYNVPYRGSGVIKGIRGVEDLAARPEILRCLCYKQPGAMLYPAGLEVDYFCSVLGTYRRAPGAPSVAAFVTGYDDAIGVEF